MHIYYKREALNLNSELLIHLLASSFNDTLNCAVRRPGKTTKFLRLLQFEPLDISIAKVIEIQIIKKLNKFWLFKNLLSSHWNYTFHIDIGNGLIAPDVEKNINIGFLPKQYYYIKKHYSFTDHNRLELLKPPQLKVVIENCISNNIFDKKYKFFEGTNQLEWVNLSPSYFMVKT